MIALASKLGKSYTDNVKWNTNKWNINYLKKLLWDLAGNGSCDHEKNIKVYNYMVNHLDHIGLAHTFPINLYLLGNMT